MKKKVALIILDGWGIAKKKEFSAIDNADIHFYKSLLRKYPNSFLEASGLAVGLPEGQMGNSEVGHLNLGAGRIIYQTLVEINKSIFENTFFSNDKILELVSYVRKENKNLHLLGLVSDGGVHSHINHLKALLEIAKKANINNVFIHAFTDGRDCNPNSGIDFINDIDKFTKNTIGKLATICGRYFAMDRDNRWERVKKAYDLIAFNKGNYFDNPYYAIKKSYENNIYDEFVEPITLLKESKLESGDGLIFFNFRPDRIRELFSSFSVENFKNFETKYNNFRTLQMTKYGVIESVNHKIIFEKDNLKNTLGEVLESNNKTQIRIAETEKYPHVTYFFSGGREKEFKNERRILCPSPKVATYDLKPEMSAKEITSSIISEIEKYESDFICLNYANADMVGHTGDFSAVITACQTLDKCLEELIPFLLKHNYTTLVLADHGNADVMINDDGSPNTYHSKNVVPCIVIDNKEKYNLKNGILADVAPTILQLMGIDKPEEMKNNSLITEKF